MIAKLCSLFVILSLLCSIKCDTICNELQRNHHLFDFAYTHYSVNIHKNGSKIVEKEELIVINRQMWTISLTQFNTLVVYGENRTMHSNAIGVQYTIPGISTQITNAFKCVANIVDERISVLIHFNGTAFNNILWEIKGQSKGVYDMNAKISYEFSLAYVPDSFRRDNKKKFYVIFMEQKLGNDSLFIRTFRIYSFEYNLDDRDYFYAFVNEIQDVSILPNFLNQIPGHFYVNGILNTFDRECTKCGDSAILLLNVNGIPMYCITNETTLSDNCSESNLLLYFKCDDWMVNTKKKKKTMKSKENKNILTLEGLKKYMKRKEAKQKLLKKGLSQEKDLELQSQSSQQTLGFDTSEQQTLDLNEPIYIKNKQ